MEFPTNGGWQFRQPQTSWVNPFAMVGKDASVDAIRKHRLANPAIAAKHQLSTDPAAIERELVAFQQARGALPQTPQPSFFQSARSSLPARVVEVAADIKRAAQGTAVVLDWLGSGGNPVAQELAEQRAAICVACPKNQPGAWFTEAPAELIRSSVKAWQSLKGSAFEFETSQGDKLKTCEACKCLMKLKVFVDSKHILGHTKPDVFNDLDPRCWILAERKAADTAPKVGG